jgi:hypothetical protein
MQITVLVERFASHICQIHGSLINRIGTREAFSILKQSKHNLLTIDRYFNLCFM